MSGMTKKKGKETFHGPHTAAPGGGRRLERKILQWKTAGKRRKKKGKVFLLVIDIQGQLSPKTRARATCTRNQRLVKVQNQVQKEKERDSHVLGATGATKPVAKEGQKSGIPGCTRRPFMPRLWPGERQSLGERRHDTKMMMRGGGEGGQKRRLNCSTSEKCK